MEPLKTIGEAVVQLKRDRSRPIRARVDDLTIELRAVPAGSAESAADIFEQLGPWEGETTDEILEIVARARERGGTRQIADL